jgi:dTDP-4-dehydrorhamnose 3,5-epimerase
MIQGVKVTPQKQILDERGKIMHFMRNDDPDFQAFGEIYFSQVFPGAIKAWHLHKAMTLNYVVVAGRIKLVLYDAREGSPTKGVLMELVLSPEDHKRVTVPFGVWNGFKGISAEPALVANCATLPHDPTEIVRMDPFDKSIPYDWALKHG